MAQLESELELPSQEQHQAPNAWRLHSANRDASRRRQDGDVLGDLPDCVNKQKVECRQTIGHSHPLHRVAAINPAAEPRPDRQGGKTGVHLRGLEIVRLRLGVKASASGCFLEAADSQFLGADQQRDGSLRNIDVYAVALPGKAMAPPLAASGRNVANGQAGGAAGKPAVGDQGAGGPEMAGLQVGGGIEHFLPGPPLGPS